MPQLPDLERLRRAVPEDVVLGALIDAATIGRWRVLRINDSRRQAGGRLVGDSGCAGWPDLYCVRGSEAVAIEAKSERGRLRPGQAEWLDALAATGVETFIARPSNLDSIVERLLR